MTSNSYEPFTENFEKNNLELYQNKQNFRTAFPSELFGKKGKYFFKKRIFVQNIFFHFCNGIII